MNDNRKTGDKLAPVRKNRRMERLRTVFAPRNIMILFLVALIGAAFVQDSKGLTIYQKLFMGRQQTVAHPEIDKNESKKYKILIDPGHGGKENGTKTADGKVKEKELNLLISKKLEKQLQNAGFEVELTRTKDVNFDDEVNADLKKRQGIIESSGADLVVSVHINWIDDESIKGPIVFHLPGSTQSEAFAKDIQSRMNEKLGFNRRAQAQNFVVLRAGEMPSVLIECGFLSNPEELKNLRNKDYQEKVAQSIAFGIADYVGDNPKQ